MHTPNVQLYSHTYCPILQQAASMQASKAHTSYIRRSRGILKGLGNHFSCFQRFVYIFKTNSYSIQNDLFLSLPARTINYITGLKFNQYFYLVVEF